MITLKFSFNSGEGSIKPTAKFEDMDKISKLDALGDWIGDLQRLYDQIIENKEYDFRS